MMRSEILKTFPENQILKLDNQHYFFRVFYSFTIANLIIMNDYAHNIQFNPFNHWNELLIQKECGNLDFFSLFFSKVATAALLLMIFGFRKSFSQIFLISEKETFPKFGQIWKLFRDDYHNLKGNIHPCYFGILA